MAAPVAAHENPRRRKARGFFRFALSLRVLGYVCSFSVFRFPREPPNFPQ
jgi:hypothetical protein